MLPLLAALTLGLTALPQDAKRPDDVVQKRDGGLLVGRVLKVEADALEILVNGEQTSRRLFFRDLMPYSVYKVRVDRIDKASGPARMDLAEFCMQQGLYTQAVREFEEAGRLDKSLEEKAKKRREDAHNEDARAKFEEAKKLHQKKDYDEAVRLLHLLLEARYEGTPYQAEAKALAAKIADEIKAEKEELKKQIDAAAAKKDAAKAEAKAQQEADVFNRTVALLEEAQKAWAEGLDQEPKNQTRAEKAWRAAEGALFGVKKNVDTMIKSNDVEQIKKAKELDRQADLWLVRTYYRLGRMFAVDLNYATSLEWLNKAMKIPHDEATDRMINDVLLTISQLKMRERAAGRGY
jgi:tetratricopeptide (TPR) repeat protein